MSHKLLKISSFLHYYYWNYREKSETRFCKNVIVFTHCVGNTLNSWNTELESLHATINIHRFVQNHKKLSHENDRINI